MQTRLFKIIKQIIFNTKSQFIRFQNQFTNNILYLVLGFITGSAFGTFFLSFLRIYSLSDGVIISLLLIWFEQIGKTVYKISYNKKKNIRIKILNCWKTGILLGFFIDAFKVGS